jgi:hypothetical protein
MINVKPVFAKLEYKSIKVINSLGPMPAASNFTEGEDVLVRFKSGKYTVGRIMMFPVMFPADKRKHVFFSTGRGTKTRQFEEVK